MLNNETGEVFVFPGPYSARKKSSQDLSNPYVDVFKEIPPYAVDVATGELLNKTKDPILVKVGKLNIQEQIQSYADDVDIYKLLERVAVSGDTSLLNRRIGMFGDFVNLPDNINDLNDYVKKVFDNNRTVDKSILEAAINESLTKTDIEKVIAAHVEKAIAAAAAKNNNGGNE